MIRLLHLSDPHFGTEAPDVVAALLGFARALGPDAVLLSGDVTQRARRAQFAAAERFVRALPSPVLCVPGNHDIPLYNLWARWRHPYRNYRAAFGDELAPVLETPHVLVVSVNSTRPGRHKNGEVGARQIEQVRARLRRARADQLRIVMLHHPVRAAHASDEKNLLVGHTRAVPAWLEAGADLLLAGHIHLPYALPLEAAGCARRAWAVQAGTAVSRRVRGGVPNSVNVIVYHPEAGPLCTLERWDHDASQGSFMLADSLDLTLSRP